MCRHLPVEGDISLYFTYTEYAVSICLIVHDYSLHQIHSSTQKQSALNLFITSLPPLQQSASNPFIHHPLPTVCIKSIHLSPTTNSPHQIHSSPTTNSLHQIHSSPTTNSLPQIHSSPFCIKSIHHPLPTVCIKSIHHPLPTVYIKSIHHPTPTVCIKSIHHPQPTACIKSIYLSLLRGLY